MEVDTVAAVTGSEVNEAPPGITPNGAENGDNNPEVKIQELAKNLENLDKRYKDSSTEAKRLYEENVKLQARLEALEKNQSSLKAESEAAPAFPSEEEYVRYWTNQDKTEKEARAEYRREMADYQFRNQVIEGQRALQNLLRLEIEQRNRGFVELNPVAKEAEEFFKENLPELSSLPIGDKIERYKNLKPKLVPKSDGKDLTAIKSAAGGSVGGAATTPQTQNSGMDEFAIKSGFKSYKQMIEASKCSTQADYAAYKKRWGIK